MDAPKAQERILSAYNRSTDPDDPIANPFEGCALIRADLDALWDITRTGDDWKAPEKRAAGIHLSNIAARAMQMMVDVL